MDQQSHRYELLDVIGTGGMAEIYRARWIDSGGADRLVALKRMLPHMLDDEECVTRFVDEARIMVRLNHPNICRIFDFGTMNDDYFITMEYIEGLDMAGVIRLLDRTDDRVPIDVALHVLTGVLSGLCYAHEAVDESGQPLKFVHRDVSPQNVLLGVAGEVKLTDLGAATASAEVKNAQTRCDVRMGKMLYMAPEQRQRQPLDGRADIYSAGLILAEMLLGGTQFHENANGYLAGLCSWSEMLASRFAPPWDVPLSQLVERSLAQNRDDRFSSAREMLSVVEGLVDEYGHPPSLKRVGNLVAQLQRRRAGKPETDMALAPRCPRISTMVSLYSGRIAPSSADEAVQGGDPPSPAAETLSNGVVANGCDDPLGLDDVETYVYDPNPQENAGRNGAGNVAASHNGGAGVVRNGDGGDRRGPILAVSGGGRAVLSTQAGVAGLPRDNRMVLAIAFLVGALVICAGVAVGIFVANRLLLGEGCDPPPSMPAQQEERKDGADFQLADFELNRRAGPGLSDRSV